jgi:hypothetical protein
MFVTHRHCMSLNLAVAAIAIALFAAGCCPSAPEIPHSSTQPTTRLTTGSPVEVFRTKVAHTGSILFRSFSGKEIGTDCDSDLKFLPDGTIKMAEYGYALQNYEGTYQLADDGTITMRLTRDDTSLLLERADGKNGFIFGNRGGATIPASAGSYWPFRPPVATVSKE